MRGGCSLRLAGKAMGANLFPMAVLWVLAVLLGVGYYYVPGVRLVLEPVRHWQTEHVVLGGFLNRAGFCGLLPGVFLLTMRSIRPPRPWLTICAKCLWFGTWGVVYGYFYHWLSVVFGDGPDLVTLLKKTFFDLFVWSLFLVVPLNAIFFFWAGHDFSWHQVRACWPHHCLRELFFPNQIANWIIWIPVMMVVYAFPESLQIHISGIVGAFWSLMFLYLNARIGSR